MHMRLLIQTIMPLPSRTEKDYVRSSVIVVFNNSELIYSKEFIIVRVFEIK